MGAFTILLLVGTSFADGPCPSQNPVWAEATFSEGDSLTLIGTYGTFRFDPQDSSWIFMGPDRSAGNSIRRLKFAEAGIQDEQQAFEAGTSLYMPAKRRKVFPSAGGLVELPEDADLAAQYLQMRNGDVLQLKHGKDRALIRRLSPSATAAVPATSQTWLRYLLDAGDGKNLFIITHETCSDCSCSAVRGAIFRLDRDSFDVKPAFESVAGLPSSTALDIRQFNEDWWIAFDKGVCRVTKQRKSECWNVTAIKITGPTPVYGSDYQPQQFGLVEASASGSKSILAVVRHFAERPNDVMFAVELDKPVVAWKSMRDLTGPPAAHGEPTVLPKGSVRPEPRPDSFTVLSNLLRARDASCAQGSQDWCPLQVLDGFVPFTDVVQTQLGRL